jgi:hypothetical protein
VKRSAAPDTVRSVDSDAAQPVCYVTTFGRVSGREHTIEIWYVEYRGCIYLLSGNGDRADWVKNLRARPEATLTVAPEGPTGERSRPAKYLARVGPFEDETHIRQAIEARYRGWRPGQPLSAWAAESLVVQLCPTDP